MRLRSCSRTAGGESSIKPEPRKVTRVQAAEPASTNVVPMVLGHDGKLYILAFDHRGSFQKKMFGIEGGPDPEETEKISDAKKLIFDGVEKAVERGVDPGPRACWSTSSSAATF
jgi:hypothetical protein